MTLLNAVLALGTLAFTIPLAIHLLFRSRFKTVPWGAMHLLDAVVRTNRRRLQLTEVLLLLVRCAIPILLALALARPVLTGFRALPGDAAQSVVIAIDDSRSMSATDDAGQTAMQRAVAGMKEYLAQLSRRDEVMLIRSSELGLPVSTMGRDEALRKLAEITPMANAANLDALVRSAAATLADASHAQRRVVLVTDLRNSDVTDAVLESFEPQRRILAAMDPPASIAVLDVGDRNETSNNLFVESIHIDSQVAVKGRELRLVARVRNDTDRFGNDVGVTWWVDGQQVESQRIAVQPNSTTATRLSHTFETAGVHTSRVNIEWPDSLLVDNQRQVAIRVIDGVEVLLVDGEPSKKPLEGETDFLAIALSPFGLGGLALPDAVRSRTIVADNSDSTKRIREELGKSPADVIVLANVKTVNPELRSMLAGYVESGGSLVVFDGDRLQPDEYNAKWTTKDAAFELPGRIGDVLGNAKQREASRIVKTRLNSQYAPWSSVLPQSAAALDEVDVFAYRDLQPRDDSTNVNGTQQSEATTKASTAPAEMSASASGSERMTLLQTATGQPLALSARWGRGRVVQFAISADGDWTTLPLRPVFLPLMQQLIIDLAGNTDSPNAQVGETLRVPLAEFSADADANVKPVATVAAFTVEPPLQKERPLELSTMPGQPGEAQLAADTREGVGVYRFREFTTDAAEEPVIRETIRVADIDPEESLLRPAPSARTTALATRLGATLDTDVDSLLRSDEVDRFGREIWRWLLALLLAALVAELFLQQRRLVKPRSQPSTRVMVS